VTTPPDPFRIRAHVPWFEEISAQYVHLSEAARSTLRHAADVAYGAHPDERLDLFFPRVPRGPAPIHMFVHGGYWRANRKDDYAFVAAAAVASGAIAAIVEYTLMPKVRLAVLVDQVRRAATWLIANADSFGGDRHHLSASGHSAGAHLASYLAARSPAEPTLPAIPVGALVLVSGIYDLPPIRESFVQPEIQLTSDEAAGWSPIGAVLDPAVKRIVLVGEKETPAFFAQAEAFGAAAARQGAAVTSAVVPAADHMTIVRDMGIPGTRAAAWLAGVIGVQAAV
jgi:arylformamidase